MGTLVMRGTAPQVQMEVDMRRKTRIRVALALTLGLAVLPLAACAAGSGEQSDAAEEQVQKKSSVNLASLKTMGDMMDLEGEGQTSTWDGSHYVYVIYVDGAPIRAVADSTPEIDSQIGELDFLADDYDEQLRGIIGELPLSSVEDLSDGIPPQKELDAFVGKTGKDLLDAGFTYVYLGAYGEDTEAVADFDQGLYRYSVTFNESVAEDSEDAAAIEGLTVKSIEFSELSDMAISPENL